jgi:hypothetical protein
MLDTKDLVAIEEIVGRQIKTSIPVIIDERVPAIIDSKSFQSRLTFQK